jgi:two-component system cell cycle sensor histidine kinase/response regulator CckA
VTTILLIDDEPAVLRLLDRMLAPRSVNLMAVSEPFDALRIYGEQKVDLLISDINMPEMDGTVLTNRVLEIQPETTVLLISGNVDEMPESVSSPRVRFLRKPFFPSELLDRIRQLLPRL